MGGFRSPEAMFEGMTEREWVGWQMFAKHFSTPLRRADLNSALERQAVLTPYCKRGRVPTVDQLTVKYGRGAAKGRKPAAEVFALAGAAFSAAAAQQQAKPVRSKRK